MVCLLAAPWVHLSVSGGQWHYWLVPISCHFRDCKALLVTSLTHVSGAIASVQTFTFTCCSGGQAIEVLIKFLESRLTVFSMNVIKITIPKMAYTSKDELLLGRGIRHIRATSQYQAHNANVNLQFI